MITIFIQGFFLQASLILALGAQNIFVLNSGLKRQNHLTVALVCSICDALLILIGVAGAATLFIQSPISKVVFGILGVIFLAHYGLKKIIESQSESGLIPSTLETLPLKKVIFNSLAFSLLNPHVYLDTVVLIGGYSAKFQAINERLIFGIGASTFSIIWFYSLAILASLGNKFVRNLKIMRLISLVSGIILIFLSIKLSIDVWEWVSYLPTLKSIF